MKRVSPLKHHPETTDSDSDEKVQNQGLVLGEQNEVGKNEPSSDKQTSDGSGGKAGGGGVVGGNNPPVLFGELEHYDLDMDEILDVPYIKSSQQVSTLPRVPQDKRALVASSVGGGTLERNRSRVLKNSSAAHSEALSLSSSQPPVSPSFTSICKHQLTGSDPWVCVLQYCVLSPVKWSDLRKSKSVDPDLHHLHRSPGGLQPELVSSGLLSCSSSLSSFSDAGLSSNLLLLQPSAVSTEIFFFFQTSCWRPASSPSPRPRDQVGILRG